MRVPVRYRSTLQEAAHEYLDLGSCDARYDNLIIILSIALFLSVTLFLDGLYTRVMGHDSGIGIGAVGVMVLIGILWIVVRSKRLIRGRRQQIQQELHRLGFRLSGADNGKSVSCFWRAHELFFDPLSNAFYDMR